MKQITKYQSDDGELFDTAEAAKAHEDTVAFQALLGLDETELSAALKRERGFEHVSDALELAGARIAKLRREAGELKRERRAKGEAAPGQSAPVEEAPVEDSEIEEAPVEEEIVF